MNVARFVDAISAIDSRIDVLEQSLSRKAAKPYSGRLVGLARAGWGLAETVGAIFATLFTAAVVVVAQDKHAAFRALVLSAKHIPNGVKNIGLGIIHSLPFIGMQIAKDEHPGKKEKWIVTTTKEDDQMIGIGILLNNKKLHEEHHIIDRIFTNGEALLTSCYHIKIRTSAFDMERTRQALEPKFNDGEKPFIQELLKDIDRHYKKLGSKSDIACLSYSEAFPEQNFVYAIMGRVKKNKTACNVSVAFHKDLG